MGMTCVECKSESCKYKCSTCYGPYCSCSCWKKHKQGAECKRVEYNETVERIVKQRSYGTEDTIHAEKLFRLGTNNELKRILRDPLLRKLLLAVDSSSDPYDSVRRAMQDPCFTEFVDICLETVEGQGSGDEQDGNYLKWLAGTGAELF